MKRRRRGRGFDLAVQVRLTMSEKDVTNVRQALQQALADVDIMFPGVPTA